MGMFGPVHLDHPPLRCSPSFWESPAKHNAIPRTRGCRVQKGMEGIKDETDEEEKEKEGKAK